MNHTLFVISGYHVIKDLPSNLIGIVKKSLEIEIALTYLIARRFSVTHYFEDSCTAELAEEQNRALDWLVDNVPGKKHDKFFRKMTKKFENDGNYQEFGLTKKIETLYKLRKKGIPIRFYITERKDYNQDHVLIAEAKETNEYLDLLSQSFPAHIFDEASCRVRDEAIFRNICEQAGENSILFVGDNHRLSDFEYGDHNFDYYRISINKDKNGRWNVEGELPSELEEDVSGLRQLKDVNVDISYRNPS